MVFFFIMRLIIQGLYLLFGICANSVRMNALVLHVCMSHVFGNSLYIVTL